VTERAQIGRALVAAMREDGAVARASVGGVDPQRLASAARYHGAAGYLHGALQDASAEAAALDAVSGVYHLGIGISMRALADLANVAPILDDAGVEWLIVKGPVVAERLYAEPGLRTFDDLDLVVRAGSFARAIEALESAEVSILDRNWRLLHREMRGQVHLTLRHGTLLDLHWHLINRDRMQFAIPMEEIFERSRTVEVAGLSVRTPDVVDTLVHLCVHASLSGGNRLVWAKDVERAILMERPAWDAVVARALAWRAGQATAAMLARAVRMFGAPVPEEVPKALGAPVRRFLDRAAARGFHAERSRGSRSSAAIPTRLSARAPAASTAVYLRRLASLLTRGPSQQTDPILVARGDDDDRRAFLDGVARTQRGAS
jgi:hypothetical protein